jgi:hypothetical protein
MTSIDTAHTAHEVHPTTAVAAAVLRTFTAVARSPVSACVATKVGAGKRHHTCNADGIGAPCDGNTLMESLGGGVDQQIGEHDIENKPRQDA